MRVGVIRQVRAGVRTDEKDESRVGETGFLQEPGILRFVTSHRCVKFGVFDDNIIMLSVYLLCFLNFSFIVCCAFIMLLLT